MQFSVKVGSYQNNTTLNICDTELLGKKIEQDELTMNISENYYGEKFVDTEEAKSLLENSSIINMVGSKTVSLSIELGVGSENGVKMISGIPFLIVFKI
jgi:uncharacterized protein